MFFIVSIISLDTGGCFLRFFEALVLAVSSVLVLDQGSRFGHLLPVAILKKSRFKTKLWERFL